MITYRLDFKTRDPIGNCYDCPLRQEGISSDWCYFVDGKLSSTEIPNDCTIAKIDEKPDNAFSTITLKEVHKEIIDMFVLLNDDDPREEVAKRLDGKDYNPNRFIVTARYIDMPSNITKAALLYLPKHGGYHQICLLEKDSYNWKQVQKYLRGIE